MSNFFSLSLVIPVYNESRRLEKTFASLSRFLKNAPVPSVEIIFVNDGSTDDTLMLLNQFAHKVPARIISYPDNCGKGYAVRTGMRAATADYALFLDADMSTDLLMFERFAVAMQQGAAIVIGTRKNAGAEIHKHQPWWREMLGKGYTILARTILGVPVTDFTCGFKCFHRLAREAVFRRAFIDRWSYDAEILYLAHRLGFQIFEIPVVWVNDRHSSVRLYRDIIQSFFDLFAIRSKHSFLETIPSHPDS